MPREETSMTKVPVKDRLRKVDVPEGRSGLWEVKRFTVSEDEA